MRHTMLRTPVKQCAMYFVVATALVLFIGTSKQTSLPMMGAANALPAGFFFLELTEGIGVMDAEGANEQVTGLIHFKAPTMRDSQLWKERFPAVGTIDVIRLENKLTGRCLAEFAPAGAPAKLSTRPCGEGTTLWQKIPQGGNRVVLRRTFPQGPTFPFPNINVCPTRDGGLVDSLTCNGDFDFNQIWRATLSPAGSASSPLTPATPQPVAPTGCKFTGGSGGVCGLVGFNCDPFSGVDEIIVKSGNVFVTVTDVEPQIGKIVGTYLNQGTVSVEVCGWRAGATSCGAPIPNVTFGPSICSHRPTPPPPCPGNLVRCPPTGTCRSQCEHLQ
jgi:hypothetical protein